jgi:hypothetical protein
MLKIRLLNRKLLNLVIENGYLSLIILDNASREENTAVKLDKDFAYRLYKKMESIMQEKDIIEELNIEPFYIKVSKYRIVIECLSLVNDSIIDFDKLGFEYCANMLKKYAMDFECRVN